LNNQENLEKFLVLVSLGKYLTPKNLENVLKKAGSWKAAISVSCRILRFSCCPDIKKDIFSLEYSEI
jgi:hypothetical protein